MQRSSSSKAARIRTAWYIVLVDVKGTMELNIGWKYSDGTFGLFSDTGNKSKSRPPWGNVIDCSLQTLKNKRNETNDYMMFQNRGFQKKAFKCIEMNPVLSGVNDFTSCVVEMRSGGRENVLALFLSLMVKSKQFSSHRVGVHDDNGINVDKTGVTEETLKEHGSSIEELSSFVELALKHALRVDSRNEVMSKIESGKKRKGSDDIPVKAKLSKVDKVVDEMKAELDDKTGLELTFQQKFMGRADIPLSKLKVSTEVALPLNPLKVSGLAAGMLQRFDPSQMSVMATPATGEPFDATKLQDNCYDVFHGRHRIAALQQLEKKGMLDKLLGMERKMVTVHIVNVRCPTQVNYGALRGNEIQSDWVRKPHLRQ
jgi:hypothetical protein